MSDTSGGIDWEALETQYRLAYEAARARLAAQEAAFDTMRDRAMQIMTVAAGISAFGGVLLANDDMAGPLTVVALGAFAAIVVLCLLLILTRADWYARPNSAS